MDYNEAREIESLAPSHKVQISRADEALDMINDCSKHFKEHLEYVILQLAKVGVDIKTADVQREIGGIDDCLTDLFHGARVRLLQMGADEPRISPFDIFKQSLQVPSMEQMERIFRAPNPASKPDLFKGDTSMDGDAA